LRASPTCRRSDAPNVNGCDHARLRLFCVAGGMGGWVCECVAARAKPVSLRCSGSVCEAWRAGEASQQSYWHAAFTTPTCLYHHAAICVAAQTHSCALCGSLPGCTALGWVHTHHASILQAACRPFESPTSVCCRGHRGRQVPAHACPRGCLAVCATAIESPRVSIWLPEVRRCRLRTVALRV
jgi:hypothetical protein